MSRDPAVTDWSAAVGETRTTSSTGGQKGVKLARFDLIPTGPLLALAEHFGRGAAKYDDNQWRQGYEWSKGYAAGMRHWTAFWGGEDYDVCPADEVGCAFVDQHGEPFPAFDTPRGRGCYNHTTSHHLACVAWHAFVGLEFYEKHPEHDDRYVPAETAAEEEQRLLEEQRVLDATPEERAEFWQGVIPPCRPRIREGRNPFAAITEGAGS